MQLKTRPGRPAINANPVTEAEVRWENPPEFPDIDTTDDGHTWYERLMPLRKRPKCWAVIRTYATMARANNATNNLSHDIIRKPSGRWEFKSAMTAAGEFNVYARFLSRTAYANGNNSKH